MEITHEEIVYDTKVRASQDAEISSHTFVPDRTYQTPEVEQWRPLVASYFLPEDIDTALCLMRYESGGNPNADNPKSTARGLMQELRSWAGVYGVTYEDLYNPSINIWIASELRYAYGWTQWSPYNRGLCRGL